jgi:hypothetical protein
VYAPEIGIHSNFGSRISNDLLIGFDHQHRILVSRFLDSADVVFCLELFERIHDQVSKVEYHLSIWDFPLLDFDLKNTVIFLF